MSEQDELVLLERVFLRLGNADTDEQLEATLGKFLCPVLLKLSSQTEGVRKKVMELLVHVNKRVKMRSVIQLPVSDIISQYLDADVSPFVKNFTILYIKLGYPRLSPNKQLELLPQLINCLTGKPEVQQNTLLQLITLTLCHIKIPSTDAERRASHWPNLESLVQTLLLNYWLDVILLPYNMTAQSDTSAAPTEAAAGTSAAQKFAIPPGFSEVSLKRVMGENPPAGEELEKIKMSILQLVGSGLFPEHSIVCHLVIGSADSRHGVAGLAELKLKQLVGGDDWNNSTIISKLYSIFLGTALVKEQSCKEEQKRQPASVQQRLKIFPYLLKSREAANQVPSNIQIVFDCLYTPNTNARLKSLAVQFSCHMCLFCTAPKFAPLGPVLLSGLLKLIRLTAEDYKLRGLAYVAVGKVICKMPSLLAKDISFVQSFFDAISTEVADNKSSVQEALIMISGALAGLELTKLKQIEALVLQNIEKPEIEARTVAVHYAKNVFPGNHIPSRYALLLACGDSKELIHNEASKAIHSLQEEEKLFNAAGDLGKGAENKKSYHMPSFPDMINYLHERALERVKGVHRYVLGSAVLPFNPAAYIEMLMYLRRCLAYHAADSPEVPPSLDSVDLMQQQAAYIAKYVGQLLVENSAETGPIGIYIGILRQLLNSLKGPPAMYCLLEIIAVAREKLSPVFRKHAQWVKGFMYSHKEDMCRYAAELYAIISVDCESDDTLADIIKELLDNISKQVLETQQGSIYCLGFIISKILRKSSHVAQPMEVENGSSTNSGLGNRLSACITAAVRRLVDCMSDKQVLLAMAACNAVGEIGSAGALPLPQGENLVARDQQCDGSTPRSKMSKTMEDDVSVEKVIKILIEKIKTQSEQMKLRERATVCLGNICVGDKDSAHRSTIIQSLIDCAAPKQFELHCTIGEALLCAVQGPCSPAARDVWTVTEAEFLEISTSSLEDQADYVSILLNLLLDKYIRSSSTHIRQAACVWLLALVKGCGHTSVVQSSIMRIQASFISLLGDSDDLTQDVVSKGLGIVYEKCSEEQKKELVASLVDTLTTGQRKKVEVTADTTVFQEGSLGKTPDGQSMSTYRELCSIANDLNQPDLIYKFMHLANHNATWNAKRGAAYGFSVIARQAGDQLAPHLDKIVPKLYRYQFDPNTRVQQAMTAIWNAIVPDSQNTINKYLKLILDDLMKNLTSSQWRVRESSCLAVNDLLRGRVLDDIVDSLPELWEICFRVRDDIKESSRNAADLALKTLSRSCIKICDPTYGQIGERATSLVLPALLKAGLPSPVAEVRVISLTTIMKIGRGAGVLLKPHIPLLAVALLESMTTLEPQMLNYLSLHAAANEQTMERLDVARTAAYKTSPMMETLNLCIPHIDEAVLKELMPRLIEMIGRGVGLGSKVCCANFAISITRSIPRDIQPYTGKLLSALMHGFSDRNPTVRKNYAAAVSHVVRVSKDSSVERLLQRIHEWYMEKEDETLREGGAMIIQSINQNSPDVLKNHATEIMPLVFLAMHDKPEEVQTGEQQGKQLYKLWEEVWTEITPGTEAGVRLYLPEIVSLAEKALGSQSWALKRQAALAMKTVADKQGSNIDHNQLMVVVKALLIGLQGRTWSGKEALLKALSTVCTSCKSVLQSGENSQQEISEMFEAAIRECKKENVHYKIEALKCTSAILVSFDLDRYTDVSDIIYPILKKKDDGDEEDNLNSSSKLELVQCAYETLGCCWPNNPQTQQSDLEEMASIISGGMGKNTWKVEVAILRALKRILNRMCAMQSVQSIDENQKFLSTFYSQLIPAFCTSLGNVKSSSLRSEALSVLQIIVSKLEGAERLNLLTADEWRPLLTALSNTSQSDTQAELQDNAQQLLNKLNTWLSC